MRGVSIRRSDDDGEDGNLDTDALNEAAAQYAVLRQEGAVNMWGRSAIAHRAEEHGMSELAEIAGARDDDESRDA